MNEQPVNISQYKLKKSMNDEHIGSIQILRNDNNQFIMKKELAQLNLSKYYSLIQSKLKQLSSIHFQRTVECSPALKDTLLFEFSKKNLEHHLQICKEKEQFVSEEDLFALLTALLECGKQMEANNEYHPALSLQNIFRVKDHFKLVNPYLFDSYMIETINKQWKSEDNERNPKQDIFNAGREVRYSRKDKILINIYQAGIIILSMGVLKVESDVKTLIKTGGLQKLLNEFKDRYSWDLTNMVTRILEHEFESFRDLQKLFFESSSDNFESNKIVSAPENFDDEIFRSISNKVKFQKSQLGPFDNESDRWQKQTGLLNSKIFSNANLDIGKKATTALYNDELNGPTGGRFQERVKTDQNTRDYLQDIETNKAWIRDKLVTKTPPRISALNNSVQRDTQDKVLGDSRFNQSAISDRFVPSVTSKFLAKSEVQSEFKAPLSNNYMGINRVAAERDNRIKITEAVRIDIMASRKINPLIERQLDNSHINVSVPSDQFSSPIKNRYLTEPNFYKQPMQPLHPQRDGERETVNVSKILERLDTHSSQASKLRGQTSTDKLPGTQLGGKENQHHGPGANEVDTGNKRQLKLEREILYNSKYLQKHERVDSSLEPRSSPRSVQYDKSPWKTEGNGQEGDILGSEYRTTRDEHIPFSSINKYSTNTKYVRQDIPKYDRSEYTEGKKNRSVSFNFSNCNNRNDYKRATRVSEERYPKGILKNKNTFDDTASLHCQRNLSKNRFKDLQAYNSKVVSPTASRNQGHLEGYSTNYDRLVTRFSKDTITPVKAVEERNQPARKTTQWEWGRDTGDQEKRWKDYITEGRSSPSNLVSGTRHRIFN